MTYAPLPSGTLFYHSAQIRHWLSEVVRVLEFPSNFVFHNALVMLMSCDACTRLRVPEILAALSLTLPAYLDSSFIDPLPVHSSRNDAAHSSLRATAAVSCALFPC